MLTTRRPVDTGPVPTVESKATYEALWWLPAEPEDKVPGKLILHPDNGIHLILNGVFRAHGSRLKSDSFSDESVILGTQYSGARFTLLTCQEHRQEVPVGGGFQRQRFAADRALIGHHFKRSEDVRLEWFSIKATHLKDWMRNVGLDHPERTEKGFFIEYDPDRASTVPELRASLPPATIVFKSQPRKLGGDIVKNPSGVEISEWVELSFDSPVNVQEAIAVYIKPLLDFLSLATAAPNSLLRLNASHPEDSEETPKLPLKVHPTTDYPRFEWYSLFNKRRMLFKATDVEGRFQDVMNAWFDAYESLEEVCDLFFGVHYEQGMRETNRFLNVIQALEAYHRLRVTDDRVILKERISELVERADPALDRLVSETEPFAKWAKDTRNFYTHREERSNRDVARGETLILLTQSLLWVLRLHFMNEVGFTPSQSQDLLEQNWRFRSLAGACAEAPWNEG